MTSQSVVIQEPLPSVVDEIDFPPGDLWSDEPPLETDFHRDQIDLLIRLLKAWWQDQPEGYVSGNLTVYFSPNQRKSEDFRGPDFFVVRGVPKHERRSWVVWQENGQYPHLIVEVLSEKTAAVDRGLKKQIYQDVWRVPDYFLFDPSTQALEGFHLTDGQYQPLEPTPDGWLWSQQLSLYLGVRAGKLRFLTPEGEWVPLPEEALAQQLEQERQQLEQERQRAALAEQELARLKTRLREQGLEP